MLLDDIIGGYRRQKFCMSKGMWHVRLCGLPLGTNMNKYLRRSLHGAVIFDYRVNTKKRIRSHQAGEIDWEAIGRAMR